jgi:hypothetical protein
MPDVTPSDYIELRELDEDHLPPAPPAGRRRIYSDADGVLQSLGSADPVAPLVPDGAAAITVDNQSDPPAEVTTLVAPGATISGDEATLPEGEMFNGGTITDPLVIEGGDSEDVLTIKAGASGSYPLVIKNSANADRLYVGPSGALHITNVDDELAFRVLDEGNVETASFTADGGLTLASNNAGLSALYIEPLVALSAGNNLVFVKANSGNNRFKVSRNAYVVIDARAAPADAELNANELAFWFDATNGAAKLRAKGKTANGTVVTFTLAADA